MIRGGGGVANVSFREGPASSTKVKQLLQSDHAMGYADRRDTGRDDVASRKEVLRGDSREQSV